MSTLSTTSAAINWCSSGSFYLVRSPILFPKAKAKKMPSLAELKKRIAKHESIASVKAEANAMHLIGRKHI